MVQMTKSEVPYPHKGVVPNNPFVEDHVPEGRNDTGTGETIQAKLPGLLSFSRACIDACHKKDDIK